MRILGRTSEDFDIAMTPLIDMMFLLIIFFVVSTAFIDPEKDQPVNLPRTDTGKVGRKDPEQIIVNVRQGGILVVGGRIVTIDELRAQLAQAARQNPRQIVKVRGDGMAYHKQIVKVYEACQQAGIHSVDVVTRIEQ